jgi:hypothetical protein
LLFRRRLRLIFFLLGGVLLAVGLFDVGEQFSQLLFGGLGRSIR